jgi:hypothetical protein
VVGTGIGEDGFLLDVAVVLFTRFRDFVNDRIMFSLPTHLVYKILRVSFGAQQFAADGSALTAVLAGSNLARNVEVKHCSEGNSKARVREKMRGK